MKDKQKIILQHHNASTHRKNDQNNLEMHKWDILPIHTGSGCCQKDI